MALAGSNERLSSTSRKRLPVVLTVLGVLVGVIALVVGLVVPMLGDGEESGDRAAVVQRAEDFAVTYNTYDVAEKDEYQERMRDLLTEGFYGEFTQITDAVFSAIDSKDQRSENARVVATAIDTIDDDSAVVLVAVNAAITTAGSEAAVPRRFRWEVTFAKEDGEWLVSQFDAVAAVEAEVGEPGEQGGLLPETVPDEQQPQEESE
ncbi:hypothetical protein ACHAAC_10745 [Aeromicrobium sp. CF4.19]|uniref:hypothetical protein n=1 Tax=Aeromicrobium sp. CF4.19 TaxID=3373082 RepID=UPI003EE7877D